jgi:hypothetical protein
MDKEIEEKIRREMERIIREDSRDAELVTDGTEDILRGRVEVAEVVLALLGGGE